MSVPLCDDSLPRLASRGLSVPTCNRLSLRHSWVHFGPSHFFCAHQAFYVHKMNEYLHQQHMGEKGEGPAGVGITVVGLRSPQVIDALNEQDGLYTLVEQGVDGNTLTVVGSIVDCLCAPRDKARLLEILTSPETHVLSLTITQEGYHLTSTAPRRLRTNSADVQSDIFNPSDPTTAAGFIVEALHRRFVSGIPPFTVLSCDNIPDNGQLLRLAVMDMARLQKRTGTFLRWLAGRCTFPDSMVDRITPHTNDDLASLVRSHGIIDSRPVPTEANWSQWVISDNFCNEKPPLDLVGVEFMETTQVAEMVKLRMVNGAHMAMGVVGLLVGYTHVHEAMASPRMRSFVLGFHAEVSRSIALHVPDLDVRNYTARLHQRLANPAIKDQLVRLVRDVTKKLDVRFLSAARDVMSLSDGEPNSVRYICLAVAAWMHFCGGKWEVVDPCAGELREIAKTGDPMGFLREEWFGSDLVSCPGFVDQVLEAYHVIAIYGMPSTLDHYRRHHSRKATYAGPLASGSFDVLARVRTGTNPRNARVSLDKGAKRAGVAATVLVDVVEGEAAGGM